MNRSLDLKTPHLGALALSAFLLALSQIIFPAQATDKEKTLEAVEAAEPMLDMADTTEQEPQTMPIRGVIRADNEAKLSTELIARVKHIGFREGENFSKNDLLLELDCRRPIAELEASRAQLKEAAAALNSATYLYKRGAGSQQELRTSQAQAEYAKAKVKILTTQIEQCKFIAPYDGAVLELGIMENEMTNAGRPLLSIVSHQHPHIELIVPSNWLVWLKKGTSFQFRVDETKTELEARVERLGAKIESVSQTIKIYAEIVTKDPRILPGMSGEALFKNPSLGG